jgi:phenylacetaldehyde dehydrogenase
MDHLTLHHKTVEFLARQPRMLIGAEWSFASSGATMAVRNPATANLLLEVPSADHVDVDLAVQAARRAFDDSAWSRMRPRERQNLLWRLAELIERDAQVIAELECLNNGKSAQMARLVDVQLSIDFLRYMAGWATRISGHDPRQPGTGRQVRHHRPGRCQPAAGAANAIFFNKAKYAARGYACMYSASTSTG